VCRGSEGASDPAHPLVEVLLSVLALAASVSLVMSVLSLSSISLSVSLATWSSAGILVSVVSTAAGLLQFHGKL